MKRRVLPGDILWLCLLLLVTLLIVLPPTHGVFVNLTGAHPYLMGFLKFAVLASMGELLALRLAAGAWKRPAGMFYKMLVWGLLGVMITFMFSFYSAGVAALITKGLLPVGAGVVGALLTAFYTSAIMNLTFGPVFMALHRFTDTLIDLRMKGQRPGAREVVAAVDWAGFINFVVFKTIPLWWIPAHTATFLLPPEYRVLVAAYLSIVLGVILVTARNRH